MDRFSGYTAREERELNQEPGFHCTNKDCDHAEYDQDDLQRCEGCSRRFCSECVTEIGEFRFCEDCAKCERNVMVGREPRKCGDAASFTCDRCGDLLCEKCVRGYSTSDAETGYEENGHVCRGGCSGWPLETVGAVEVTA